MSVLRKRRRPSGRGSTQPVQRDQTSSSRSTSLGDGVGEQLRIEASCRAPRHSGGSSGRPAAAGRSRRRSATRSSPAGRRRSRSSRTASSSSNRNSGVAARAPGDLLDLMRGSGSSSVAALDDLDERLVRRAGRARARSIVGMSGASAAKMGRRCPGGSRSGPGVRSAAARDEAQQQVVRRLVQVVDVLDDEDRRRPGQHGAEEPDARPRPVDPG